MRKRSWATGLWCVAALTFAGADAFAQDAGTPDAGDPDLPPNPCPGGAVGCASAAIAYSHRVGLPLEFSIDTGWLPAGSPVQMRFQTALTGHTLVQAAGNLQASWPMPMELRTNPTAGTGLLETDYGVVLDASVRLHLTVGGTPYNWEGRVPYVPHIDFRAMASTTFDPWAWAPVNARGSTMRQHLADVPLTDAFISIPGISGGLSFDAQADLSTDYHSTRFTFGGDADPLTASLDHVLAYFSAGPSVDYFPQLEGEVDQTITLRIYPSLYVSLLGSRWMVDLFELPIDIGPIAQPWIFDPSHAHLLLPDVQRTDLVIDFGDVTVGDHALQGAPFDSIGDVDLAVYSPPAADPFSFPRAGAVIPPHSTVTFPVQFAPTSEGPFEQRVPFRTTDPDTSAVYVTVRGNGVRADGGVVADASSDVLRSDASDGSVEGGPDAGTGAMRGGCGCRAAGHDSSDAGARGSWFALAVALSVGAGVKRRRRA